MTERPIRHCGDCQLCCKLLPVRSIHKGANERCRHQRHHKGCAVYHTLAMPYDCKLWNCRWLVNDDATDLPRPDRAHYVIDVMPDYITISHDETGEEKKLQVVVVWCDPKHPDAHRDPRLRAYLERRGQEGIATLVRYNARDGFVIFPPSLTPNGQWHEQGGKNSGRDTDPAELLELLERDANAKGPRRAPVRKSRNYSTTLTSEEEISLRVEGSLHLHKDQQADDDHGERGDDDDCPLH